MLQVGDAVPDFTVESDTAGTISAADLRGQRYVVYFYPKDDTPGCTKEACSFRDNLPDFKGLGVPVFGASADDAKAHGKFAAKYQLNFPLLIDPDKKLLEAFGVPDLDSARLAGLASTAPVAGGVKISGGSAMPSPSRSL